MNKKGMAIGIGIAGTVLAIVAVALFMNQAKEVSATDPRGCCIVDASPAQDYCVQWAMPPGYGGMGCNSPNIFRPGEPTCDNLFCHQLCECTCYTGPEFPIGVEGICDYGDCSLSCENLCANKGGRLTSDCLQL